MEEAGMERGGMAIVNMAELSLAGHGKIENRDSREGYSEIEHGGY